MTIPLTLQNSVSGIVVLDANVAYLGRLKTKVWKMTESVLVNLYNKSV